MLILLVLLLFAMIIPYHTYVVVRIPYICTIITTHCHFPRRSMIPDVIDDASIKMNFRREELFYAFFVFGSKFAVGITLGLSTGTYECVTIPYTLKFLRGFHFAVVAPRNLCSFNFPEYVAYLITKINLPRNFNIHTI